MSISRAGHCGIGLTPSMGAHTGSCLRPPQSHTPASGAFLILCDVWSMDNGLGIQHPGAMSPGANVHLGGWGWGADSSLGLSKKKSLNKFLSPFPTPLGGSQGRCPDMLITAWTDTQHLQCVPNRESEGRA